MFEGLVTQLLLGYLGRYIKDFHKDQLKITLWNEEVLFENVELILEAFDYLQLPFALKRGNIGRLSIRIPWKKLGWDPIIILLEDVFFLAGPRDDHEWSADAVEKRDFAAKKAKLAAAELAKLSRRVCGNQAGQSLISHVTGRILDSIQVSMRNVHVLYCEMQPHSMLFGLRFSSLTIAKQNPIGALNSKAKSGQVNKNVEIHGLGIYCSTFQGSSDFMGANDAEESQLWQGALSDVDKYDYVVLPFDLSFLVVKSGKLEQDAPQYSLIAELTKLDLSINPDQLHHILKFSDNICTCQLREKYGRYRPWGCPLSQKLKGWQKLWWHYAQESVLSEVRKKLKKTSWRYLGERLDHRRKYVNLYKLKLNFLRKDELVDQDVVFELELMEKASDVDDILQFRSIAERELEDTLHPLSSEATVISSDVGEKRPNEEAPSGRTRGWLNWLSRGVLGAGGTDDSSQFSGVVSDEVIKDICEVTKFQPMPSVIFAATSTAFLFAVNFHITQMSLSMKSGSRSQEIADCTLSAVQIECNVWEESTSIMATAGSAMIIDSSKKTTIMLIKKAQSEEDILLSVKPSPSIEIDVSTTKQMAALVLKVTVQPAEIHFDLPLLHHLMEFYSVLESHKSLQLRVLGSLNGIKDSKSRLLYKTECVLSQRQRINWDVNIVNISMHFPWNNANMEACTMVVQTSGVHLSSNNNLDPVAPTEDQSPTVKDFLNIEAGYDILDALQLSDVYDHYEVSMDNFQMTMVMPCFPQGLSVVEKFSASVMLTHCIIPDEMTLKQLEARFVITSLHLHFSPSICGAFASLAEHLHLLSSHSERVAKSFSPVMSSCVTMPFCFSIASNFELFTLEVNFESDGDNSSILLISLQQLHLMFANSGIQDCRVSIRAAKISTFRQSNVDMSNILCLSSMDGHADHSHPQEKRSRVDGDDVQNKLFDACFRLHYMDQRSGHIIRHVCSVNLNEMELHCYPYVVGLLAEFCEKLMVYNSSGADENHSSQIELRQTEAPSFRFQSFGLSNPNVDCSTDWASISLDQFPFVKILNCGGLRSLENSMIIPECRSLDTSDKKIRMPNSNILNIPSVKFSEASDHCLMKSDIDSSVWEMDLDLVNISLHFHDSSGIVGSIALPVGKVSVVSHADNLDVLSSMEGLTLYSAQWTYNLQESLWGPSIPSKSPVLNVRARKGSAYLSNSDLEISFGIQHVCCILPPDYLAVLIGYFSLPDWTSSGSKPDDVTENSKCISSEKHGTIIYKFELLNSIIISPVSSNERHFLKLDLRQLSGSFIDNDALKSASIGIFSEFLVPQDKLADRAHSLNIFGRDLCLSLLTLKDYASSNISVQNAEHESHALVQSLNIDFWLRIQGQSQSTPTGSSFTLYILTKISSCDLIAQDSYFLLGFEALLEVIDEHSIVDKKSGCFTTDIPEFLQLAKSLKENTGRIPNDSTNGVTEIRCSINHMSVKLSSKRASNSRGMVAEMEASFKLSATLENDMILSLNTQFSSLFLSSSPDSICLAKCLLVSSCSSVLEVHFSKIQKNEIEVLVTLPSLEIWFHLLEWVNLVEHLNSCTPQIPQGSAVDVSGSAIPPVNISAQTLDLDELPPNAVAITVMFRNTGLICHIPLWVSEEAVSDSMDSVAQSENLNARSGGKDSKFLIVTLHSRSSELHAYGNNLKIKTNVDKATASVGICENGVVRSWPFFQLLQLAAEIQFCEYSKVPIGVEVNVNCEAFDVWLSYQVLYFWHGIEFAAAEANTSEMTLGNIELNLQLSKVSLLLTDGRWSCSGPLMELLMRNLHVETSMTEKSIRLSTEGDLLVNYNNIHKVLWEPLVEPWNFKVVMVRKFEKSALLDNGIITDVQLESMTQLNVNFTRSLCEVVLRTIEMIKEARGLMQINEVPKSERFQNYQCVENLCIRRYASYTIHNMTSLPFIFQVYQGLGNAESVDLSASVYENTVQPGSSVPIYIDGMLEEQAFSYRPASSQGFSKKLSNKTGHYFMTIRFEGTSNKPEPISMDLVGITYFEVNFSKDSEGTEATSGLLVPVVFDVSLQRYSKLIQLYSTVIFKNSTSTPLELRFDIPFSMSSKVVDPIYPGEEFPLPLHLAEAGHMRWRPLGNNYLWSEVHNLSKTLSSDGRSGFLRSLVCYPTHTSSHLFRCCLSVQDINLPLSGGLKRTVTDFSKQSVKASHQLYNVKKSKTRFIHRVTLNTPLTVKCYLPQAVSATIEGGGITHTESLTEAECSLYHVDSSYDLAVTFHIAGFRPSAVKFPRSETFSTAAKPSGSLLSLTETLTFDADSCDGPIYITVEKTMDSLSGARELCISVPFLLYNCTLFPLTISRSDHELKGNYCIIPTCYDSTDQGLFVDQEDGLHLISSQGQQYPRPSKSSSESYLSKNHIDSSSEIGSPRLGIFLTQSLISHSGYKCQSIDELDSVNQEAPLNSLERPLDSNLVSDFRVSSVSNNECLKAKPFMYSPDPSAVASEIMVRVSRSGSHCPVDNFTSSLWSNPFFLVAPSGSTTVLVPQESSNSAAVISVTSHLLDTPLMGRTRAITFQPRYVISNACSKALCYKQKGTGSFFRLGVGQHSHLHWTDTTRELLVAVRFDEPGWQWSGCFLPDCLGDTQVKMRNYASGNLNIIRVEVQNADIIQDEKFIGNAIGKSGTNFILLSDDNTGFVPYRVDNFSEETLRIYQQKCETLETIVHPYTSCPYAWDEPFYPHRLIVEVPGERIVGSYVLDDIKEYAPVHLSSSSKLSERHEKTLLSSVHAEGAMKVLSIIDSTCHVLGEVKSASSALFGKKRESNETAEKFLQYKEKLSVRISFIGISLMDSSPQELLYASAKDIKIDCLQNMERQKFSFQMSSLQIDNQLRGTPYPIILSFDEDYKSSLISHMRNKDGGTRTKTEGTMPYPSGSSSEPVICLAASKWRNREMMLVSFEHISLRIRDLQLAVDLELLLKLQDFFKASSLFNPDMANSVTKIDDVWKPGVAEVPSSFTLLNSERLRANGNCQFPKMHHSPSGCHSVTPCLPEIVPIGAPWQKIFLLARSQNKIYVESFSVSPVKVTLSFSSNPWMLKNGGLSSGESFIHRGIMALADVEGAQLCLSQLTITHHMGSWESIHEIILKHYTRRFLHEMYKVFGSAGVIGNPMGFARRVGLGFKDFLSVPAKGVLQSPSGLLSGMAQGTGSLLSNTLYAISDTATQFSKAAHKGILAFTFDDHDVTKSETQRMLTYSQSKGVINELLEGLTGLLQSPIKGAEKHGLPGVLSGLALGVTGLVAKPAASVLEATGRTAQSIRNRSKLHRMRAQHLRVRLPRSLSTELALRPYSWEEAIGTAVLLEVDDGSKFRDELLVLCKSLKDAGKFVILTEKFILVVECSSLVDLGKPEFRGIVAEPPWIVSVEIALESVMHVDADGGVVHIVGSSSETLLGQNQHHQRRTGVRMKRWNLPPTPLPLFQTDLELASTEEAEYFLRVLLSTIEQGRERGWGNVYLLHQCNIK